MPARPSALITGITGQDGLYLAELLHAKGYEVHGLVRGQNNPRAEAVMQALPEAHLHLGDLTDLPSLVRVLDATDPTEVYNLGAISQVGYSFENAHQTTQVTGLGALNMLEAVRLTGRAESARFYQASSSEMFGKVQEIPQTERTRFWPRSPYGTAKAFAHHTCVNYRESYGMHASSGILFNHESPRRGTEFVTRKVTRAVAAIHLGLSDHVTLGNLDAGRDWGFAGDYVEAMWLMLQQAAPDDYVVATGETHTVRELLDAAFGHIGVTDWASFVRHDPSLLRPAEVDHLVGDATKARTVLGWKPQTTFDELVQLMVDADLADLAARHR